MSTTHLHDPLYYDQQLISILFIMSTTHLYPLYHVKTHFHPIYHVNNSSPSSLSCQQLISILFIMSTHHLPPLYELLT